MYRLSVLVCLSLFMMTSGKHPKDVQEQKSSTELISSSSELVSSSTEPVTSLKSEPPTTAEFVPSVKSESRQGSLYLSSEDLSNVAPHESDHHDDPHDHLDHEDLEHHDSDHDDSDDHNLSDGDSSHDHEDQTPSAANATDLKGKVLDHVEIVSGGNSSETSANDTTTTSFEDVTETEKPVDLTATDSTGCFMGLRDQMEQRCFNKFQEVIFDVMGEPENKQVVCCALEDYEKCSLRGYQKTHCENDRQGLKESLRAARLFMAAMNNVSCSMHRGRCSSSASAVYTTGLLSIFMGIILFLLL